VSSATHDRAGVTAVVLAGGKGTRIRTLYPDVPKPMIEVAGKPFLHWVTTYLIKSGVSDFVYSTGHLGDQIADWCANGDFPGVRRRVCPEVEPLGTGGGLLNCLDLCQSELLTINGDSLCLGGAPEILDLRSDASVSAALLGVYQEDTSRYGTLDFDEATQKLRAFREKAPGRGYVNAGVYFFRKQALLGFQRGVALSIERDVIPDLLTNGSQVRVVPVRDAAFIDIGVPETVVAASAFIEANKALF